MARSTAPTSGTRRCRPTSRCSSRRRSTRSRCHRRAMRSSELGFRLGIGAFAAALLLIVIAIGLTLANDSWLSLQKFGLNFWRTSTWDPVSGEFGALPFIWGTLYSSVLALLIATPVSLGIAVFIS